MVLDKTQAAEGDQPPQLVLTNTPINTVEVRQPAILQADETSDLRLITAYAVTDNVVQVTMTPSSTQAYS